MLHGDISNKRSFVIGVRCENCLFEYKDSNIVDKFLNIVHGGKLKRATLNEEVLSLMNYIYWDTEMTVELIIDKENYNPKVEKFLSDLPFNQVGVVLTSISELTMRLNTGDLTYVVTNDRIEQENINSKYAVDVNTMNSILKRVRR